MRKNTGKNLNSKYSQKCLDHAKNQHGNHLELFQKE